MFSDDCVYDDPLDPVPQLTPHSDNDELFTEISESDLSLSSDLNTKKENSYMCNALKAFHRQEYGTGWGIQ